VSFSFLLPPEMLSIPLCSLFLRSHVEFCLGKVIKHPEFLPFFFFFFWSPPPPRFVDPHVFDTSFSFSLFHLVIFSDFFAVLFLPRRSYPLPRLSRHLLFCFDNHPDFPPSPCLFHIFFSYSQIAVFPPPSAVTSPSRFELPFLLSTAGCGIREGRLNPLCAPFSPYRASFFIFRPKFFFLCVGLFPFFQIPSPKVVF